MPLVVDELLIPKPEVLPKPYCGLDDWFRSHGLPSSYLRWPPRVLPDSPWNQRSTSEHTASDPRAQPSSRLRTASVMPYIAQTASARPVLRARSPSTPDENQPLECGICNKTYSRDTLRDHRASSHLGVVCHFPGTAYPKLMVENYVEMTRRLMEANSLNGRGQNGGKG
ncbi:hypothetical protein F4821DRAFT_257026 [Hypoxylon rubiginosum]|uniref:Uncharacterized protein n=1 Tax=Hypoxylon rubiginosum TaxID=110542 RepID=A0ACC0D9I7_9PEZI|nr:hypothetical protein F4821DRAFT_257026 [Hypoxylon rubiginosum]